jgi:adenylate cyclase
VSRARDLLRGLIRPSGAAQRTTLVIVAIGVAVTATALVARADHALGSLESSSVDARFAIRGTQPASPDVAVVAIDDVTFSELGLRWPFPRSYHARAIDSVRRAGARVIAYDVQFSEPSDDPAQDDRLLRATARARNVVLAAEAVDEHGDSPVFGGPVTVRAVHATIGNALLPNDSDGRIRRDSLRAGGMPTFAVAAYARAVGHPPSPAAFGGGSALIDFRGPPHTMRTYSFSRLVAGHVPASALRGKIVVVGATDPSLHDDYDTSTTSTERMPGVEVQASAIDTLLRGVPLRGAPASLDSLLIVLMGVIGPLAAWRLRPSLAPLAAATAGFAYVVGAQLAFDSGTVVTVAYPLGALALSSLAALSVQFVATSYERQRTREVFGRFVPEAVVDEVLARTRGGLRLGGVRRTSTILFSDLRGFTSFAEGLPVERVIEALNHYLGEMSDAILDHGGTLVAYMGDGIMAVFGAPIEQDDHAQRAVECVREMIDERLPRFNEWIAAEELGEPFRMGIGLNTGEVMSGNVGSARRMEYTALGDTTNTAARLEGMTKGTPHQVLIAESTACCLEPEVRAELIDVGQLEVRGRQAKVRLWSLPAGDDFR